MRAGRKAHGYGLTFPSPWVIDILGKLDFDYVFDFWIGKKGEKRVRDWLETWWLRLSYVRWSGAANAS